MWEWESQAHSTMSTQACYGAANQEKVCLNWGERDKNSLFQMVDELRGWLKAWVKKQKNRYYFELWIMQTSSSIDKDMQLKLSTMGPL